MRGWRKRESSRSIFETQRNTLQETARPRPTRSRLGTFWSVLAVAATLAGATAHGAVPQPAGAAGKLDLQVPNGPVLKLYRESHALVIGASRYRAGWPDLPGVPDDVTAVKKLLEEQGFQVTAVNDPTRDELDRALRRFVQDYGQLYDSRLVVYFAGHGYTLTTMAGGRLGYIVPVDAPHPDAKGTNLAAFKAAAYSMENIEGLARQMDAKHALFIFDSCFSGTIFRTRGTAAPDSINVKMDRPVRQFITAGDETQTVPDRSIFRRQLEAGLRGEADLNHDGYITGSELGAFLEDTVANYSRRTQTPRSGKIRDPDLDRGDVVFASVATARSAASPVATPVATSPSRGGAAAPPALAEWPSLIQSRLGGAAFYVPKLNATIVADGNLPGTLPLGLRGIGGDGTMSRPTAIAWVAALNASRYLGYSDWRLPRAGPINGATYQVMNTADNPHPGDDGSVDLGFNLSAPGTRFAGSTSNELAFLFFNTLGAIARHGIDGTVQDMAANDYTPLRNVRYRSYWTSADYGATGALAFNFLDGTQYAYEATDAGGWRFNVIVLRTGDVDTRAANR